MKERSVINRNLTGGFFGGVLGILCFGYIHPHTLVLFLGCSLGVLSGWYYQEIFQSAIEGLHRGVRKTQEVWSETVLFLTMSTKRIKVVKINLEPSLKVIHFLVFLVMWAFHYPITFHRWLKKHPMNQVYVISFFVAIIALGLTALWMIPAGFKLNDIMNNVERGSATEALIFISALMLFTVSIAAVPMYLASRAESMRSFYTSWSLYSRQGTMMFFFREVVASILCQLAVIFFSSGIGLWFIAVGGLFLVAIIAPLSFVIGVVKGIYAVATKPGHWLCLVTTLTVTSLFAWQSQNYFEDSRILWVVALMAGVVSAIATEGLRRLIELFYERNAFIRKVAITEIGSQLAPSNKFFLRISEYLNNKFFCRPLEIVLQSI